MPAPIKDKFSKLSISRQRRYQLRMRAKRRCVICGKKAKSNWHCAKHDLENKARSKKVWAAFSEMLGNQNK